MMNRHRTAGLFIGLIRQQRSERSARANSSTEMTFEPARVAASGKYLTQLAFRAGD
jgi:hypothetical protein